MSTKERGQILTNRQIAMLASSVSKDKLVAIAQDFMRFTHESVTLIQKENCDDIEALKRKIIQIWANRNPENQVKVRKRSVKFVYFILQYFLCR